MIIGDGLACRPNYVREIFIGQAESKAAAVGSLAVLLNQTDE